MAPSPNHIQLCCFTRFRIQVLKVEQSVHGMKTTDTITFELINVGKERIIEESILLVSTALCFFFYKKMVFQGIIWPFCAQIKVTQL